MGVVLSTVATIAGIAGTASSIYGSIQQGNAMGQAENNNALIYRQQAQAYRNQLPGISYQKEVVTEKAKLEELKARRDMITFRSAQEALYGKAGITLTGSALAVIVDSAANAELDIALNNYNNKLDLYNLDVDRYNTEINAVLAESGATQRDIAAKSYRKQGYLNAGKTLLTSASDYYSKYGGTKSTTIQGGVGGKTIQTSQFGKTWSPYA